VPFVDSAKSLGFVLLIGLITLAELSRNAS
jgi:hypothetical protein